jgi:hypothetical protein
VDFTGQEVKPCSVSFVQESYAAQDRTPVVTGRLALDNMIPGKRYVR